MDFSSLKISSQLVDMLASEAISEPTAIQQSVIPAAMDGKNLVASAQTGSGKTLAYLLPLFNTIIEAKRDVRALILAPTRELAAQIGDWCHKLSQNSSIHHSVIYGGVEYKPQIESLSQSPQIIVATPGRLIDIIEQKVVNIENFTHFVLDEVDQMLDLGFIEPINFLASLRGEDCLTLCFSATVDDKVKGLITQILEDFESVEIENEKVAVELIDQTGFFVEMKMMDSLLVYIFRSEKPELSVVFCRSKKMADRLTILLKENGFAAEAIHSDRSQTAREYILERFKNRETTILVATDIIARGIDISGITHVINYGLPLNAEQYIHRIGRTARAGSSGKSISLCTPDERAMLDTICKAMKQHIKMSCDHPMQSSELTRQLYLDKGEKKGATKHKKKK